MGWRVTEESGYGNDRIDASERALLVLEQSVDSAFVPLLQTPSYPRTHNAQHLLPAALYTMSGSRFVSESSLDAARAKREEEYKVHSSPCLVIPYSNPVSCLPFLLSLSLSLSAIFERLPTLE